MSSLSSLLLLVRPASSSPARLPTSDVALQRRGSSFRLRPPVVRCPPRSRGQASVAAAPSRTSQARSAAPLQPGHRHRKRRPAGAPRPTPSSSRCSLLNTDHPHRAHLTNRTATRFCRLRRACSLRRVCCRRFSGGGAALPMARRGVAAEAGQQSARLCCGAEWGHIRPYARRSAGAQSRSIACPLSERSSTGAGGAAGGQYGKDVSPAPLRQTRGQCSPALLLPLLLLAPAAAASLSRCCLQRRSYWLLCCLFCR